MPKKMKKKGKPAVHDELHGFDIKVNEFGEIVGNFNIDELNQFLNKEVKDKKLGKRGNADEEE